MSKAIKSVVRLMVPAGQAKPAPPVGPALGQAGLNIMSFCKDFNAKTADIKPGTKMRVQLKAYVDKSYEYELRMPPTSHFVLAAAGVVDGSAKAGDPPVGAISLKHVYEIAKVKQKDNESVGLRAWCKQIISTARAMGIDVVRAPEPEPAGPR